jgi:hypothetical protein
MAPSTSPTKAIPFDITPAASRHGCAKAYPENWNRFLQAPLEFRNHRPSVDDGPRQAHRGLPRQATDAHEKPILRLYQVFNCPDFSSKDGDKRLLGSQAEEGKETTLGHSQCQPACRNFS